MKATALIAAGALGLLAAACSPAKTTPPAADAAGKAKIGDNVLWGRPSTTFWAWACERVLRPCKSTRVSGTD